MDILQLQGDVYPQETYLQMCGRAQNYVAPWPESWTDPGHPTRTSVKTILLSPTSWGIKYMSIWEEYYVLCSIIVLNTCFSVTCRFKEKNFFLFIYASGSSPGARIRMWVPSIKPMTPGNPPSSSKLVRMASLSFAVKLHLKTIVKVISGKFIIHLFFFSVSD